jgi:hypothetical protein
VDHIGNTNPKGHSMKELYTWKKIYALRTPMSDDIKVGDVVRVDSDTNGVSLQKVLSVTVTKSRDGSEFQTVLVEQYKD